MTVNDGHHHVRRYIAEAQSLLSRPMNFKSGGLQTDVDAIKEMRSESSLPEME
jgi:hypothetical protein